MIGRLLSAPALTSISSFSRSLDSHFPQRLSDSFLKMQSIYLRTRLMRLDKRYLLCSLAHRLRSVGDRLSRFWMFAERSSQGVSICSRHDMAVTYSGLSAAGGDKSSHFGAGGLSFRHSCMRCRDRLQEAFGYPSQFRTLICSIPAGPRPPIF